jgi:RNA polymerase sigma-B factor
VTITTSRPDARTAAPDGESLGTEASDSEYAHVDRLFDLLDECTEDAARQRCRRRIITTCLPLADHIAYKFVGRGVSRDDLIQVARMGLIKTVDRFRPDKGRFLAFAIPTITGEVRRYFRDQTWTVRVPRKIQETQIQMRAAVDTLSQELRRSPTSSELARELHVDRDHIVESQAATSAYQPMSLDAPLRSADGHNGDDTVWSTWGADDARYDAVEDMMLLQEAIADLDPRRRAIVGMSFFDGMTQRQIARRLGVSQVQVSRLLSSTLQRIRERMCLDAPVALCMVGSFMGYG